jgi:hypothetical protein
MDVKKKRVSFRSSQNLDLDDYDKRKKHDSIRNNDGFKSIVKKKKAFFVQAINYDIDASIIEASLELVEEKIRSMKNAFSIEDDDDTMLRKSFTFRYMRSMFLNLKRQENTLIKSMSSKKVQLDQLKDEQRKLEQQLLETTNEV